ncbi:MAG: AMP-binding protein, partial [Pseudomonadota bacterium]|nr:AMP-binding protein [Pseudomonadota bacterium]
MGEVKAPFASSEMEPAAADSVSNCSGQPSAALSNEPDWITTPHLRPDFGGPVDREYMPFADPAMAPPIVDMLQAIATRYRDRIAVECEGEATTYAELWKSVCRLTHEIDRAGGAPGHIAILLPSTAAYVAAVFASLAARRLCVLLDESYPESRNSLIAAQTNVSLVLCSPERAPAIAWPGVKVLCVSEKGGEASEVATAKLPALPLDDPAFILCTSGSAGQPKPIVHSQRTLLHWARTTHDALHVRADDRVLSLSSLSSLGGFTGLLNFILAGVCLQMLDVKANGLSGLLETLASRPVTILRAAPSMLRSLAKLPEARMAFSGLRLVQTYGEPLPKADLKEWRSMLPHDCFVRSTYGSTEASGLSWFAADRDDHDPIHVAAGALMPDTMAAIVDDNGAPCVVGTAGELWIRSRYNALGEWTDGRLVAGRLALHPSGDGTRVYKTGDLARRHSDGVFVVLGRLDRMVKVNGQRLEPSEIEVLLRAHPAVQDAEVIVVQSEAQGAKLLAFVIARDDSPPGLVAELRCLLRKTLPSFMMPSR